jgi:predicted membrane channel-forming protein YqfA (hemolysin III family)
VGAVIYALGLIALFGVSGTYHRERWTTLAG